MRSKENTIVQICQTQFSKIQESYLMYANNPYLPNHVHQLRVNMRKMRALLNFLKPVIDEEEYREMNLTLRDVGQTLGPLRDLDVLIENCTVIAENEPELMTNYTDVFRFLEKERLKLIKSLSTKKAFKSFKTALKNTSELINRLDIHVDSVKEENMIEFVENRFNHKVNKLEAQYGNLDESIYEDMHNVRKQAKKVRYTADGFKEILPKKERKAGKKKAKKIHNKLGELTDAKVIIDLLEEYKEKTSNDHLKDSFSILIDYYTEQN